MRIIRYGIFATALMAMALTAGAEIPQGYYNQLDGKSGAALKTAVRTLSAGHTVVTYNTKTWPAFEKTDLRVFRGKEMWWDMYSNNIVYTDAHESMNIEHSVANSWWGGRNGSVEAYSDLFLLNPSDGAANNIKGSNPPGEVQDARLLDNGLLKVGTPVSGQGGGAASVFEPADEYKGDFARAYFYTFTAYDNLSGWKADTQYVYDNACNLQPWARELLLKWHREDPVDTKEKNRNEEIYKLQNNRNPFIDYPELAEYIWGNKAGESFDLSAAAESVVTDRPAAPTFPGSRVVGVDTYAKRWWNGFMQDIDYSGGTLKVSLDGRTYYEPAHDGVEFDAASQSLEQHVIKAYVEGNNGDYTLRSPVATLTLTSRDPAQTEYTTARWQKLTSASDINLESNKWVIVAGSMMLPMVSEGGTTAVKYMPAGGLVDFDGEGMIVELPYEAAVVEFESLGNGKHKLKVCDITGKFKGYWNASGKNQMKLNATTYTPGTWEGMGDDDSFKFRFDQNGSLKYNYQYTRYVNYEDNATQVLPVYLYRFVDMDGGTTGIETVEDSEWAVGIDGNDIIAPEGAVIYDLNGRRVDGRALSHGIYIVTGSGRSVKVII